MSCFHLIFRYTPLDLAPCLTLVAGFHRARPSITLDKYYSIVESSIEVNDYIVNTNVNIYTDNPMIPFNFYLYLNTSADQLN